jgi:hypothetical protein
MKNKLFLAGTIGALLVLALAFSTCDDGGSIQTVKAVNIPVIAGVSKVDVAELKATVPDPDDNYYVVSWDAVARVTDGDYDLVVQEEGKNLIEGLQGYSIVDAQGVIISSSPAPDPQNYNVYSIKNGNLETTENTNIDKYSVLVKRGGMVEYSPIQGYPSYKELTNVGNIPNGGTGGRVRFGVQVKDYLDNQSPIVWSEYKAK